MSKRDYYEVLGLARSANQEDIKKAYKKLAFEYHPDRNPGNPKAEERFKEVSEAYQVLNNPNNRARYDSFGHMSGEGVFSDFEFRGGFGDLFENLFEEVFNAGGAGRRERGRDLKYNLELSFEEAAFGAEREISVQKRKLCSECRGTGAAHEGQVLCTACGGRGAVRFEEGFFAINRACRVCGGAGRIIKKPCNSCRGEGFVLTEQNVRVKVPAGVDNGARLRIRGEGEGAFHGHQSGDLYIEISVKEHPFFKREGKDIFCQVPVSFIHAALGAEIEVPTLEGKSKIEVPAGTQPGQTFKLKGRGVQGFNGRGRGDLYIKLQVEIPVNLSSKQKRMLEEFARLGEGGEGPLVKGFFDKFRELFG